MSALYIIGEGFWKHTPSMGGTLFPRPMHGARVLCPYGHFGPGPWTHLVLWARVLAAFGAIGLVSRPIWIVWAGLPAHLDLLGPGPGPICAQFC
jgi:hypothetical protein